MNAQGANRQGRHKEKNCPFHAVILAPFPGLHTYDPTILKLVGCT